MSISNLSHEFDVRITYADTDRMGVVYYANYLTLFEQGRTELMREMGIRYRDMEEKDKVYLPVSEVVCKYLAPAHYDELIRIKTTIKGVGAAHIDYAYIITSVETGKKLAEGSTRHPFVNQAWKPIRIPAHIREKLPTK